MKVAFATDNGNDLMKRHFGDADYYDIYDFSGLEAVFVKRVTNSTEEDESVHADPKKAKGIAGILIKEKVTVVSSLVYGPNLKRIKKKFVCLIMKDKEISTAIEIINKNKDIVEAEYNRGEDRTFLSFREEVK